jgi:hypothetical protein
MAESVPDTVAPRPIREWRDVDAARFKSEILPLGQPAVLRGVAADWPAVKAFRQSADALVDYLTRFDSGELVVTTIVPPDARGRMAYEEGAKELNHRNSNEKLSNVLKGLLKLRANPKPPGVFMGGLHAWEILPGLERENGTDLVPPGTLAHAWIGNAVTVSPHFDAGDNLAVVVAGKRRFTLFPPDQARNLYIGPFDLTPAGQPISMVAHHDPDFDRFPRFRDALAAGQSAELEPGDAIYIPYLWWHGVESLESLNMLVNFWWYPDEIAAAHPYGALMRATFELYRTMPAAHRKAWKAMYDHWVFECDGDPAEHLEPAQRTAERQLSAEAVARFREALALLLS